MLISEENYDSEDSVETKVFTSCDANYDGNLTAEEFETCTVSCDIFNFKKSKL